MKRIKTKILIGILVTLIINFGLIIKLDNSVLSSLYFGSMLLLSIKIGEREGIKLW